MVLFSQQVNANGVVSFGDSFSTFRTSLFPTEKAHSFYAYVVAPFWSDIDISRLGQISWEILTPGVSSYGDRYFSMVSQFIRNTQGVAFEGSWMMLVNYDEVPPYVFLTHLVFVSAV